jgi:hypothetical protein
MINKPVQLVKGLNKDITDFSNANGNITFGLNAIMENFEGNVGNIKTEPGNSECWYLPEGYQPIGFENIDRDSTIIFSTNGTKSEIGIVTGSCSYETMIRSSCLGFDKNHPIKAIFKLLKGCERTVYFIDGYNSDKSVNFDSLETYTSGETVENANLNDTWDCNEMRLQPEVLLPIVTNLEESDSGGLLRVGQYSFAVEVLDESLNRITIHHTPFNIAIFADSLSLSFDDIDGASNIDTTEEVLGGVPEVTKSIRIEVSNVDTRFAYARIWVLRKTSGDGTTVEVFQKNDLIPISSDTFNYVFTGIQAENGDIRKSIDEIVVARAFYESSKEILQVDNRLVRANLVRLNKDYSEYQRIVNEIEVEYITEDVPALDAIVVGNSKNPSTYFEKLSNCGDEVYARGVVFLYNTGEITPVFHIPGRAADSGDLEELTIIDTLPVGVGQVHHDDVKHLDLAVGETVPKWKVYNTANAEGKMAYWEAENATYPVNEDCNGDFIFGDLAGLPIRHHKYPSREIIPLVVDETQVRLIGTRYSNVQYPDTDIVGHFFVSARRDTFNRTVIDKGYGGAVIMTSNLLYSFDPDNLTEGIYIADPINAGYEDTSYGTIVTPKMMFTDSYLRGDYIKSEFIEQANGVTPITNDFFEEIEVVNSAGDPVTLVQEGYQIDHNTMDELFYPHNRKLNGLAYVNRNSLSLNNQQLSTSVLNGNLLAKMGAFHIDGVMPPTFSSGVSPFIDARQLLYLSIKVNRDVYPNLFNIPYYISSTLMTEESSETFDGDVIIAPLKYSPMLPITSVGWPGFSLFTHENMFVESEVNSALRNQGGDALHSFYVRSGEDALKNFLEKKAYTINSDGEFLWLGAAGVLPDFYKYNSDFTVEKYGKVFFSNGITYDYCNKCSGVIPNKIVWSPKSLPDEITDSYKFLYENDYSIVGTNPITNIFHKGNALLVIATDSAYTLAPNPQTLATDVDTVFLTSGAFLSLPARKITSSKIGYAGNQGRFNSLATEYGYVTVDQQAGEVYIFTDGFDRLSNQGLRNWFKENLPSVLVNQMQTAGINYQYADSYTSGIGLVSVYDPRFKRFILHKKDYEIANFGGLVPIDNPDTRLIYYNEDNNTFIKFNVNQTSNLIEIGDPRYFINKSWTVSYSFDFKQWTSFHSYMPSFMYYDVNNFYTFNYDNQCWKHDRLNFLSFYGELFPFMVEFIISNLSTNSLETIEWYGRSRQWNSDHGQWKDVIDTTFNRAWVYNKEQSTGEVELNFIDKITNPYGGLQQWSNSIKPVITSEEEYRLNELRNISTSNPFASSAWVNIDSFFNLTDSERQGYIDKVMLTSAHNYNMNQHLLSEMRSKYHFVRLMYYPEDSLTELMIDVLNNKYHG